MTSSSCTETYSMILLHTEVAQLCKSNNKGAYDSIVFATQPSLHCQVVTMPLHLRAESG